jgi:hypothetical protein
MIKKSFSIQDIKKNLLLVPSKKHWQIIASSVILIATVAILLPMLLSFAIGIGRLIITIALILFITLIVSRLIVKYKQKNKKDLSP